MKKIILFIPLRFSQLNFIFRFDNQMKRNRPIVIKITRSNFFYLAFQIDITFGSYNLLLKINDESDGSLKSL